MPSFFETYKDIGGGDYVSADEKKVLAEAGIPFEITTVVFEEEGKFGARYVTKALIPDPETGEPAERLLPFAYGSNVESRDRQLKAMEAYLDDADAEPVWVKLNKVGQAYVLEVLPGAPEKPKATRTRSRSK